MGNIIVSAVFLIVSVIVALLPTDNKALYWFCWIAPVIWAISLLWDIYHYRRNRWCK
jgi:hypothetical protein